MIERLMVIQNLQKRIEKDLAQNQSDSLSIDKKCEINSVKKLLCNISRRGYLCFGPAWFDKDDRDWQNFAGPIPIACVYAISELKTCKSFRDLLVSSLITTHSNFSATHEIIFGPAWCDTIGIAPHNFAGPKRFCERIMLFPPKNA